MSRQRRKVLGDDVSDAGIYDMTEATGAKFQRAVGTSEESNRLWHNLSTMINVRAAAIVPLNVKGGDEITASIASGWYLSIRFWKGDFDPTDAKLTVHDYSAISDETLLASQDPAVIGYCAGNSWWVGQFTDELTNWNGGTKSTVVPDGATKVLVYMGKASGTATLGQFATALQSLIITKK